MRNFEGLYSLETHNYRYTSSQVIHGRLCFGSKIASEYVENCIFWTCGNIRVMGMYLLWLNGLVIFFGQACPLQIPPSPSFSLYYPKKIQPLGPKPYHRLQQHYSPILACKKWQIQWVFSVLEESVHLSLDISGKGMYCFMILYRNKALLMALLTLLVSCSSDQLFTHNHHQHFPPPP